MQPSSSDTAATEREAKDAWSPTFIAVSAACALVVVLLLQAPAFLLLLLPLFVIALVVVPAILAWFCYDLVTRRFRHALSIFVAVAMAVGIVRCAPLVAQVQEMLAFHARLPQYERQVEEARAHRTTQEPLQVVVDYQDRSPFVTANLFYYVIYDETDGAGPYRAEFWPYAGSSTGVMTVAVPPTMRHLAGHYYAFGTSY